MKGELLAGVQLGRRSPVTDLMEAERLRPDSLLLRWDSGGWSVKEFASAARCCALMLQRQGITVGDRVAIMSGNSEWRLAWQYGIYWIGAVEVSLNSELRGAMLEHCFIDSDPAIIILEKEFESLSREILPDTPRLFVADPQVVPESHEFTTLDFENEAVSTTELSTILYTSGTTGPSKGVMLSQAYFSNLAENFASALELESDDVGYFTLPFFHVDFHLVLPAAIQRGAAIAFNRRFSVTRFWSEVKEFNASWVFVIGALLSALETKPVPQNEHRVTRFIGAPIPESSRAYFGKAGIGIQAFYGQTECDGVTFETTWRHKNGSAGWPCAGIDVEIHDERGVSLEPGMVGEIVLRPRFPNLLALGYWKRPEATLGTRTGLWHHTGDLGRIDEDGFLFYEGRLTDSIRKRGENISAYELEGVIRQAAGILECAAVSVFDELGGEDEIKIFVRVGAGFSAADFFQYCCANLPRFAIPRFLEVVPDGHFIYSVGTGVIQKHRLSKATEGPGVIDLKSLNIETS